MPKRPDELLADRRLANYREWVGRPIHTRILIVGAFVLSVLVLAHGINGATVNGSFFGIDQENNLFTWLRVLLYFCAGVACLLAARSSEQSGWVWNGLGVLMLAFSLDDLAMGHEWLEQRSGRARLVVRFVYPVVGAALVALFFGVWRRLERTPRLLVAAAGFTLVFSEVAASLNTDRGHAVTIVLQILEQTSEAAVGVLILAAAAEPALDAVAAWALRRGPAAS